MSCREDLLAANTDGVRDGVVPDRHKGVYPCAPPLQCLFAPRISRGGQGAGTIGGLSESVPRSPSQWRNCQYSENLEAHPLSFLPNANGLGFSYSTAAQLLAPAPGLQEYQYPYAQDVTAGVGGLNAPIVKVDGWSDWTSPRRGATVLGP